MIVQFRQAVASQLGLTLADMNCLDVINTANVITPSVIAERTGLTNSAITGILDRLEKAKLITRTHDRNDRRRVLVSAVSMEEQRQVNRLFQTLDVKIGELMQGYSLVQQEAIKDFLRRSSIILGKMIEEIKAGS